MGKGSGLHGSMLAKQCLIQEVRFQCGPQVPSLPRDGGIYFPTSCRWLAPGPSNPTGGPAGTVDPSGTCLQRMGTTHFFTLVTLSHRMKNLAKRSLGD